MSFTSNQNTASYMGGFRRNVPQGGINRLQWGFCFRFCEDNPVMGYVVYTNTNAQNAWVTMHPANVCNDLKLDFVTEAHFPEELTEERVWRIQPEIIFHHTLETAQGGDRLRLPWHKPVTPVNKDALESKLKGYNLDKSRLLMQGFSEGFRLGFTGTQDTKF